MALSAYDKEFLNQEQQAAIIKATEVWLDPNSTEEEKRAAEQVGIDIRKQAGYYGGPDGSEYHKLEQPQTATKTVTRAASVSPSAPSSDTLARQQAEERAQREASINSQRQLLAQQQAAEKARQQAAIERAVQQQTAALQRALEDAQPKFREQAESISRDERQAMDNAALYAELRGDRGGIGQSQYNEVQAQAARNRQQVQSAQIQLATDTQRQIEDLRSQGEFQKADVALQLSQQYLQQLASLERWAAEYNLSADQFQASLMQWQANYEKDMAQFNATLQQGYDKMAQDQRQLEQQLQQAQAQHEAELGYKYAALGQSQSQYDSDLAYKYAALGEDRRQYDTTRQSADVQNALKNTMAMGQAMLEAGIMPTADQLTAMGITKKQAEDFILQLQLAAAQKQAQAKQELTAAQVDSAIKEGNFTPGVLSAYEHYHGEPYSQAKIDSRKQQDAAAKDPGAGVNPSRFRQMMTSAATMLQQKSYDKVLSAIEGVWKELDRDQRLEVFDLLNKYPEISFVG